MTKSNEPIGYRPPLRASWEYVGRHGVLSGTLAALAVVFIGSVVLKLFGFSFATFSFLPNSPGEHGGPQRATPDRTDGSWPTPNPSSSSPSVAEDEAGQINRLRARDGVSLLADLDNHRKLSQLPAAIFGFTEVVLADSNEMILDCDRPLFTEFEIHKLQGGQIRLCGFVNADMANAIAALRVPRASQLTIYNAKLKNAPDFVSIPWEYLNLPDVAESRGLRIDGINCVAIDLAWK